jgi:dolichyl-phosphate-mannose--protein O-mannosyl transferase
MVRALSALGNLVLWWSACAVAIVSGVIVVWRGVGSFTKELGNDGAPRAGQPLAASLHAFLSARPRAVLTLLAGALAFLSPWVLTHRDSYIYHFLPTYALLLILLAGFTSALDADKGQRAITLTVLVAIFAGVYAPLSGFVPISEAGFNLRLPFESWR